IAPGETRTLKWVPTRLGIYPFYCTDFCSALHQEMQGYLRVSPAGASVPLVAKLSDRALTQTSRLDAVTSPAHHAASGTDR
ncbi:MAG TPA: nitrous oxide reductase, partial [Gemmatimonadaceae bacterium]|nr:nitrous oxide reductase [Gemmatimonadaceae bacterium]